jgi:phytanoyl-CoA hydroxylase
MQHTGPLSSEQLTFWSDNGYLVIPGFVESAQMRQMKESAVAIMKSVDPSVISVFTTDTKQVKTTDQYAPTALPRCIFVTICADRLPPLLLCDILRMYFLDSATEVRCFFEEGAIAADGSLTLAPELCINKIGHALHEKVPVFERLFATEWVLSLLKQLGQIEPAITQSM